MLPKIRGDDVGTRRSRCRPAQETRRRRSGPFTFHKFHERRFGRYFWTCERAVLHDERKSPNP